MVVLNDLTVDIKEGEITVFIGKNGVGKSTLVSLLSGQLKPESGEIYVNDLNVKDHIDEIRSRIGLCPQEDLIFPRLSVVDHLRIFGMIKRKKELLLTTTTRRTTTRTMENVFHGYDDDDIVRESKNGCMSLFHSFSSIFKSLESQIDHLLDLLEFSEFKYKDASTLSGGQKRKLSFAISIIGNPEILILDEVSTGVDIHNRQIIWNVLQQFRKQPRKIIILTTHQMEEADVLGDQIHIMKNGQLEVSGSSLYLKNHYGIGYCIEMTLQLPSSLQYSQQQYAQQQQHSQQQQYSHEIVTSLRKIQSYFEENISDTSKFKLIHPSLPSSQSSPYSQQHSLNTLCVLSNDLISQFPSLLKGLSLRKEELGIASFMVTQSTLEQVVLKFLNEE
nr:unnamed protein product [Naegleria fowleri]